MVYKNEVNIAISIKDLMRRFNSLVAVNHISLDIPKRSIFGLLGPNGAGKSTVIKILTTLLLPTSGNATICGYDVVSSGHNVREIIGYVPQLFSADAELTGYENLLISAKLYDLSVRDREQRIKDTLEFIELKEYADRLVRNYSGGMIRKLEIAQAVLHRPKVLFLDEPTVGLDPVARHLIWKYITDLRRKFNTTIVLTTHDMEEADRLCDLIGFMNKGKVSVVGRPTALKRSVGKKATLDDVFIYYTGNTIKGDDSYEDAKQVRRVISLQS